jgi:hypothetical protein
MNVTILEDTAYVNDDKHGTKLGSCIVEASKREGKVNYHSTTVAPKQG